MTNLIPYCICFFYFNCFFILLLLDVKNVAYHSKYTKQPILKAWTFKGITLFHLYRDKKISEQRMTSVLLEVYKDTDSISVESCENKQLQHQKLATANHSPLLLVGEKSEF